MRQGRLLSHDRHLHHSSWLRRFFPYHFCLPTCNLSCVVCKEELAKSLDEYSGKARNGLHNMDEEGNITHVTDAAECIDKGDDKSELDELNTELSLEYDTLLQLKQQIFNWGPVPRP